MAFHVSKENLAMGKMNESKPNAKWVTVALNDDLHGEVRSQAVRQHKDWSTVVTEAMALWLAAQRKRA